MLAPKKPNFTVGTCLTTSWNGEAAVTALVMEQATATV